MLLLIPGILLVDWLITLLATAGRALFPGLENPGLVVLELALAPELLPPVLGAPKTALHSGTPLNGRP